MHTFTDNRGREWSIEFDADTVARLRGVFGMRPLDLIGTTGARSLGTLYLLVIDQAERRGVTIEEFADGFCGDDVTSGAGRAVALALHDHIDATKQLARRVAPLN